MTPSQYAKKHNLAIGTVYRWVYEKRLPAKKVLVEHWDVEDVFIEKRPRNRFKKKNERT